MCISLSHTQALYFNNDFTLPDHQHQTRVSFSYEFLYTLTILVLRLNCVLITITNTSSASRGSRLNEMWFNHFLKILFCNVIVD